MDLETLFPGDLKRLIPRAGRISPDLGSGFPTYETDDQRIRIFESLIVLYHGTSMVMYPRSYGIVCMAFPDGLCRLHPAPKQKYAAISEDGVEVKDLVWKRKWRPKVHVMEGEWIAQGSQRELEWRLDIHDAMTDETIEEVRDKYDKREQAKRRALAWLKEHLNFQQRLELAATNTFRVRGLRNTYRIYLGDGFSLLDGVTGETMVRYCLHPEYWLPDADVALATKLLLEDEEGEVECLTNARGRVRSLGHKPTRADKYAYDTERALGVL